MKEPMKSRDVEPKTILGIMLGGNGHYSTEYHKKCTYVMFKWINFTNNDHIVDFLTLVYGQITGQSDPDKYTDLCQNTLIINDVAF